MSCGEEFHSRWLTEELLSVELTKCAWKTFSYFENKCQDVSSLFLWPRAMITWLFNTHVH